MLYQTLVGTWPNNGSAGLDATYIERIQAYLLKVVREAGRFSNWINPDEEYETALQNFIAGVLNNRRARAFQKDFNEFVVQQRDAVMINALSQQVMKLTSPGVPDIYQGTEVWDDSLVDPDNRRPVDFESRSRMLHDNSSISRLIADRLNGGIKLELTRTLLQHRRENPALYADGEYTHVRISGPQAEHVVAYTREYEGTTMLVVLPRLLYLLTEGGDVFGNADIWADTELQLPASLNTNGWSNLFTKETVDAPTDVSVLFAQMPLAFLTREGDPNA